MKTLERIITKSAPEVIESLNTNYYYYNYDIHSLENEGETTYSFIQVRVHGIPTYEKCVRAIIRLYLTQEQEFDIINSANKVLIGITRDQKDLNEYKEYLRLLEEIKSKVKEDFIKE